MSDVIIIPDSFKGTLASGEICGIVQHQFERQLPGICVSAIPVADGGEGTVDAFLAAVGGEKVFLEVTGPFFEPMQAFYGILPGGTAVVEMAACAGLPLAEGRLQPDKTTTYGVGQLVQDALNRGCTKIILGLGGSATNDLGCGAAAALGVKFYGEDGKTFVPVGGTLSKVARIDASSLLPALKAAELTAMCDIDNPLYGPTGAASVFAPQKGADAAMVAFLDGQLRALSARITQDLGRDISQLPGAGAAGGMGGGMAAFFGAALRPGIDILLDTINFEKQLQDCRLVVTGEGRIDSQSLRGKAVVGVARRAKAQGVPAVALAGAVERDISSIYDEGVSAVFSINQAPIPFEEARPLSRENLAKTAENLARLLAAAGFPAARG